MKKTWTLWLISLALTIGCLWINRHEYRVEKMIQLEFASSAASMHQYITTINSDLQQAYHILYMNTLWDYGFLISYSLLALFSLILLLDVFQLSIKPWMYMLSFITGLLDAVENHFLYATATMQQEHFCSIYYWAVRIKWGFAVINVLLILMVLLYGLMLLLRVRK